MIVSPCADLSVESRCILLHILESHLLRWPTLLPEKTGEWYSGIIGERVLMRKPALAHHSQARLNGHTRNKEVRSQSLSHVSMFCARRSKIWKTC